MINTLNDNYLLLGALKQEYEETSNGSSEFWQFVACRIFEEFYNNCPTTAFEEWYDNFINEHK